jgi:hypothetical protein
MALYIIIREILFSTDMSDINEHIKNDKDQSMVI